MTENMRTLIISATSEIPLNNPVIEVPLSADQARNLGSTPRVDLLTSDYSPCPHNNGIVGKIWAQSDGSAELVFMFPGKMLPDQSYVFSLKSSTHKSQTAQMYIVELPDYQGQETYKITTPSAIYYYHKTGAGFASIIDVDGKDWLNHSNAPGSAGVYRGIPNLVHPENYFHPGGTQCRTEPPRVGPLRITLNSSSNDNKWACRWDIFTSHARLTVLKADHPYWFLYEGTPAGNLEENFNFCVRSDGFRRQLFEQWDEVLPSPKWVYFGKTGVNRVLFVADQLIEQHTDSYFSMEKNMTVFGFGRKGLEKFITSVPHKFTIGFCETSDYEQCVPKINATIAPVQTKLSWTDRLKLI